MIDFIKTLKEYCEASGLEYRERVCDRGSMRPSDETPVVTKDGGYRASLFFNEKELVYGFSPIPDDEIGLLPVAYEIEEGAQRSLLYALINRLSR